MGGHIKKIENKNEEKIVSLSSIPLSLLIFILSAYFRLFHRNGIKRLEGEMEQEKLSDVCLEASILCFVQERSPLSIFPLFESEIVFISGAFDSRAQLRFA